MTVDVTPPVTSQRPPRIDDESLLDLVGEVARRAESKGHTPAAVDVSMPVFNKLRREVDAERGISDPKDSDRIPTAEAVLMRFDKQSPRKVRWHELVEAALKPFKERAWWLGRLRGEEEAEWLTGSHVRYALRRVAHELDAATVTTVEYTKQRDRLLAEDQRLHGEDGVLGALLPTLGQVLYYCNNEWEQALEIAGLAPLPAPAKSAAASPPPLQTKQGMPVVEAIAFFAALNNRWPSYHVLQVFAREARFALRAKPAGPWGALRAEAAGLLEAAGISPPTGAPKALGKGKRLTITYPLNSIPGAPPAGSPRSEAMKAYYRRDTKTIPQGEQPRRSNGRRAPDRELCLIALRVWLADGGAQHAVRSRYVTWRAGTIWPSPNGFAAHGGFTALKQEALAANQKDRRAHGVAVPPDLIERAKQLRGEARARLEGRSPSSSADALAVEPVLFAQALQEVLAGPTGTALVPAQ